MAESIVPLRKKIKNSLTRQGMWNIRGLHGKELAEGEEKERVLSSERAHKQVLTVDSIGKNPFHEKTWLAFEGGYPPYCKYTKIFLPQCSFTY